MIVGVSHRSSTMYLPDKSLVWVEFQLIFTSLMKIGSLNVESEKLTNVYFNGLDVGKSK